MSPLKCEGSLERGWNSWSTGERQQCKERLLPNNIGEGRGWGAPKAGCVLGKRDILFRPEQGSTWWSAGSLIITTVWNRTCYEQARKEVMGSRDSGDVWITNSNWNAESFFRFIPLFSEKTATTIMSTALIAHFMHAILRNMSPERRNGGEAEDIRW